jgi:small subunit ribosomal protein S16
VAVRIRMKKLGRRHRPYFRICAMDIRQPRDGRVLEELGTYDPMVPDTDARAILNTERITYWLSVGATASERVGTLIKKYGTGGPHGAVQRAPLERPAQSRRRPEPIQPPPRAAKPAKPARAEKPAKPERKSAVEAVRDEAAATEAETNS